MLTFLTLFQLRSKKKEVDIEWLTDRLSYVSAKKQKTCEISKKILQLEGFEREANTSESDTESESEGTELLTSEDEISEQ